MSAPKPGTPAWLALVCEEAIDPQRAIIDPHHHLWPPGGMIAYDPSDLRADTGSGHNVVKTVFVECGSEYHADGPEHLRPTGETEFVAATAAEAAVNVACLIITVSQSQRLQWCRSRWNRRPACGRMGRLSGFDHRAILPGGWMWEFTHRMTNFDPACPIGTLHRQEFLYVEGSDG